MEVVEEIVEEIINNVVDTASEQQNVSKVQVVDKTADEIAPDVVDTAGDRRVEQNDQEGRIYYLYYQQFIFIAY